VWCWRRTLPPRPPAFVSACLPPRRRFSSRPRRAGRRALGDAQRWIVSRVGPALCADRRSPIRQTGSSSTRPAPIIFMAANKPCWTASSGGSPCRDRCQGRGSPTLGGRRTRWRDTQAGDHDCACPGTALGCCRCYRSRRCAFPAVSSPPSERLASIASATSSRSRARRSRLRFGPEIGRRLDQAFGHLAEPIEPIRPDDLSRFAALSPSRSPPRKPSPAISPSSSPSSASAWRRAVWARAGSTSSATASTTVHASSPRRHGHARSRREALDPACSATRSRPSSPDSASSYDVGRDAAEPLERKQTVNSLIEDSATDVSDLIDTLMNRVGERALYRLRLWQATFPSAPSAVCPPWPPIRERLGPAIGRVRRGCLPHPEPVETVALLPDHPPVSFTWRGVRRRVRAATDQSVFLVNGGSAMPSL
jgi:hypothetical protein